MLLEFGNKKHGTCYVFPSNFFWLVCVSNSIKMSGACSDWQDQNEISDTVYGTMVNYWNFHIHYKKKVLKSSTKNATFIFSTAILAFQMMLRQQSH